ncbi:MAG: tetratricopeptide repeat protein [Sphingobacteriaceae bacterium]|nr:tetratricopeptide repeat protein [Sphingobacteriaceae bacterium]
MWNSKRFLLILILPLGFSLLQCTDKAKKEEVVVEAAPEMDPELVELNKAVRRSPKDPEIYHKRALYYMSKENYDFALVDMRSIFNIDTNNAAYFYTAGELFIKIGAFDQADEVLRMAAVKNPSMAKAYVKRGELAFYNRLYNTAMKFINDGLRADINYAPGYFWKGMVYLEQNNTEKAMSSFMTTIEQDPDFTEAYMQLALILSETQPTLAWQYLNNVTTLDANHIEALYARGLLIQNQGYSDSALIDYKKILDINPKHIDATYNIGYVHLLEKRFDEAIVWFSKTIEIDPKSHRAFHNRGLAYELKGDSKMAVQDYKEALKIEPGFDLALKSLNRIK